MLDTTDGHTLVLTSRRAGNTSIQQMYSVGVNPARYRIVVAKGVQSPRPAYEPIAAEIVLVNTPGVTTSDLSFFEYKHRRRPLFLSAPVVSPALSIIAALFLASALGFAWWQHGRRHAHSHARI